MRKFIVSCCVLLKVLIPIVLIVLVTATPSVAQVGGSLAGTVKDPSGAVIPGVSVTVANTVLGTMFTATSDGQGLYSFPKLPVGRYDVTMQIDGFKPQKRTGIAVDADSALQINVTLEVGEQSRNGDRVGQRRARRHGVDAARRGRPVARR